MVEVNMLFPKELEQTALVMMLRFTPRKTGDTAEEEEVLPHPERKADEPAKVPELAAARAIVLMLLLRVTEDGRRIMATSLAAKPPWL